MKAVQFAAILALLLFTVFAYGTVEGILFPGVAGRNRALERTPLYELVGQHLMLSLLPTALAFALSLAAGCLLHYAGADELKRLALSAGAIGETFPSVAIIALTVPTLGYGNLPCMLALFIYAILPIMRNTVTGLGEVRPAAVQAARGMGMSRLQVLTKVELPLAMPVIVAGLRVALIINISAATLGATVGAGGLGVPIISGIRTYDTSLIVKGTLPVLLIALLADQLLTSAERSLMRAGSRA